MLLRVAPESQHSQLTIDRHHVLEAPSAEARSAHCGDSRNPARRLSCRAIVTSDPFDFETLNSISAPIIMVRTCEQVLGSLTRPPMVLGRRRPPFETHGFCRSMQQWARFQRQAASPHVIEPALPAVRSR